MYVCMYVCMHAFTYVRTYIRLHSYFIGWSNNHVNNIQFISSLETNIVVSESFIIVVNV